MATIVNELISKYQTESFHFIAEQFFSYSINQNKDCKNALNYAAQCILNCNFTCECPPLTEYQKYHSELFEYEQGEGVFNYNVPFKLEEVFHFHHGLRYSDQKIKKYIWDRDILDVGGYFGDSACILQEYTKRHVYSYEISKQVFEDMKETISLNNLQNKVIPIRKGISDTPSLVFNHDSGDLACSLDSKRGKNETLVETSTIDSEVRDRNMKVGFIKADVEGLGYKVLLGAIDTIKKYRPVFEFAVYHSFDELVMIPEMLRNFPNYFFEFHSENTYDISMGELALFAFPAEILYDNIVDPNYTYGSFVPKTHDPIGLFE
ncbi:methyltransferase, FkbM family protein [Trichomonas vaginalis G3]|uniref:Methyltransferase, FkbM family protein n=1 Tax=Trichomonas vaginalis (strain ATCC PRA-98 / G3) TaxID=412133 RepID=A2FDN2_TRIV3|nr:methyltransferase, FKBM family protein family [Trichomonas vaginalis G3]EAX96976.1 methyltransferase, FkbM family protein [Trichomonas vaginalis G3]KAI5524901.1 methyltransferase, FKBM family protein family [Trichomonas vaginalis G3]|eukprot:XP_001309906.1 methyltransferase, FkbM family protein [Trichomonas vaginalis G3]